MYVTWYKKKKTVVSCHHHSPRLITNRKYITCCYNVSCLFNCIHFCHHHQISFPRFQRKMNVKEKSNLRSQKHTNLLPFKFFFSLLILFHFSVHFFIAYIYLSISCLRLRIHFEPIFIFFPQKSLLMVLRSFFFC